MAPLKLESIHNNEVHLWLLETDKVPADINGKGILTTDEIAKLTTFELARVRKEFLLTRIFIRKLLSQYDSSVAPSDWRFLTNPYGRPATSSPAMAKSLHFNISHTEGLIVCALAAVSEVGVDVEDHRRRVPYFKLAETVFSPLEVAQLRSQPRDVLARRFFNIWTLKESYIKARGMGLSLPLEKFSFHLEDPIRISFAPGFNDSSESWQFTLLEPTPVHQVALALRSTENLIVKQFQFSHGLLAAA